MLVELYNRKADGTVKEQYLRKLGEYGLGIYCDANDHRGIYGISTDHNEYELFRYCAHCNSDLYGRWEYYCRTIYWKNRRDLFLYDFCFFPEDNILINGGIDQLELEKELEESRIKETWDGRITYYKDALRDSLNVADSILQQYRNEIVEFRSMTICPICGHTLSKDKTHSFATAPCPTLGVLSEKIEDPRFFDKRESPSGIYIYPDTINEYSGLDNLFKSKKYESARDGDQITFNCFIATKLPDNKLQLYKTIEKDERFELSPVELTIRESECLASKLSFFRSLRVNANTSSANARLVDFVSVCDNYIPQKPQTTVIASNPDCLKEYIRLLVNIESLYYSVSERLLSLYLSHVESKPDAQASSILISKVKKENMDAAKSNYLNTANQDPTDNLSLSDFPCNYPPRPVPPAEPIYPPQPNAPIPKKPNLFNKKKVIQENDAAVQKYNEDLEKYQEKKSRLYETYLKLTEAYQAECKKYDIAVADVDKKRMLAFKEKQAELRSNHTAQVDKAKKQFEIAKEQYDISVSSSSSLFTPENAKNKLIEDEIIMAEASLNNIIKVRKDLYSYDVIFSKYRNLVALTTIYEYLVSGRCVKLDGPDGAYNLYESEIRMNTIVGQLSQVIDLLDEIKNNQYTIYSTLKAINNQLSILKNSMNSAISALNTIKSETSQMNNTLKNIEENAAVAAHYSQVSAYYSKRNAELTDAIGFMTTYK